MAVARKKSGDVHICIVPGPLNQARMSEHYQLPVVDHILDRFNDGKVFSKLDVTSAYGHLELEKTSSLLTCIIPFGLSVSGEIFQRHITQTVECVPGVACIAEDITPTGKDDTHTSRVHYYIS